MVVVPALLAPLVCDFDPFRSVTELVVDTHVDIKPPVVIILDWYVLENLMRLLDLTTRAIPMGLSVVGILWIYWAAVRGL